MEKTYVIVRNVKEGNRLLRRENKKNSGHVTANVGCYHLVDFAKDIILQMRAAQGELSALVLLDKLSCAAVLDTIFKENDTVDWFVPKACQGISTAAEVLESLNMLRLGRCTKQWETYRQEAGEGISRDREHQLFLLISMLEKRLKEQDAYDEALLFLEAVRVLKEPGRNIRLPKGKFWVSSDCIELLTAVEREFLRLLTNGQYEQFIQKPVEKELLEKNAVFFRGYGMANEVEYVAKKIKEKGQAFGEVSVLYTSPEYEPFLKGVLGNRGISYRLISSHSALENSYVAAMLAILEFAENGYVYEDLKHLIRMPRLKTVYQEGEKKKYWAKYYYRTISEGIAWGRERYIDFVERRRTAECEPGLEKFLEFLKDLVMIFALEEDKISCDKIFWRLVEFVKKYIHAPLEWKEILGAFKQEAKVLERLPVPATEQEMLGLLKQRISVLTMENAEEQNCVSVAQVGNSTTVLERRFVYVLGLSADAFGRTQADSAVLSDKERKEALEAERGFVELREEREQRKNQYLEKTLDTFEATEGNLYLGYSSFDTMNLREQAPAVIYLQLLRMAGKTQADVEYMGYPDLIEREVTMKEEEIWKHEPETNKSEVTEPDDDAERSENAEPDDDADKPEDTEPDTDEDRLKDTEPEAQLPVYSATALQTLVSCPLKFYYQRVKNLPNEDYKKRIPDQWLSASERGTFSHGILERYCNKELKGVEPSLVKKEINEVLFQECAKEAEKAMVEKCPYDSMAAYEMEYELVKEKCRQYLMSLHKELSAPDNKWMVMECEAKIADVELCYDKAGKRRFDNAGESENTDDADNTDVVKFGLQGFMDRVDGYEDEEKKEIHLRILDYKSGSRKKLEEGIKKLQKLQHIVYTIAAKEMNKREGWKVIVDSVDFLHFFEADQEKIMYRLSGAEIEEFPEKVRKILVEVLYERNYTVLEKLTCNISTKDKLLIRTDTEEDCKYCTYKDICREEKYMGVKW